jgi:hypothetical protein
MRSDGAAVLVGWRRVELLLLELELALAGRPFPSDALRGGSGGGKGLPGPARRKGLDASGDFEEEATGEEVALTESKKGLREVEADGIGAEVCLGVRSELNTAWGDLSGQRERERKGKRQRESELR